MKKHKEHERRQTTSCGAVTWQRFEGRTYVLLILQFKHNSSWGIPKGHLDPGEAVEHCAIREVFEETGIRIELGARLPDTFAHFKNEDKTVISFLAQPKGYPRHVLPVPNIDDPDCEVAAAKWFPLDELPLTHPFQVDIFAAIDALKHTFVDDAVD